MTPVRTLAAAVLLALCRAATAAAQESAPARISACLLYTSDAADE